MQSFSKVGAWLCLLLMLASTWAMAVHRHSSEDSTSSCQICVAAHSSAPAVVSVTPKPEFHQVYAVRHQPLDAQQHLVAFALYVRPPPNA